jgi:uncharacterized YigZ family protein
MSTSKRIIPARETRVEQVVVNSRFIATAAPAFDVEQAKAFIQRMREEFADASHNVPAYKIGHGINTTAHTRDDGEPSGTAGKPILSVLLGSEIGDIVVVVTRYFGGTKLGTGGLVRAYSDSAKAVLKALPLAVKASTVKGLVVVHYRIFEQVKRLVKQHNGVICSEEFTEDVTLTLQFLEEHVISFESDLSELTKGQAEFVIVEKNADTIMQMTA